MQHASFFLDSGSNLPPPPAQLTWAAILAEEPFEGEHWEGVYGLPSGFVRHSKEDEERRKQGRFYDREKESQRLDWDSRWSTPSLSPLNSGDLALDNDTDDDTEEDSDIVSDQVRERDGSLVGLTEEKSTYNHPPHSYAHRREFEILQGKQYWRNGWNGDGTVEKNAFNMGDASTLGKRLSQILAFCLTSLFIQVQHCVPSCAPQVQCHILVTSTLTFLSNVRYASDETLTTSPDPDFVCQKYINEEDAVREVLMALQGRKNIMLEWKDDENSEGYYTVSLTLQLRLI